MILQQALLGQAPSYGALYQANLKLSTKKQKLPYSSDLLTGQDESFDAFTRKLDQLNGAGCKRLFQDDTDWAQHLHVSAKKPKPN